MRTHIHDDGYSCTCGFEKRGGTHVPVPIVGAFAAQHIAEHHPRKRLSGTHQGCLRCDCEAIYEPVVRATDLCACGHSVGTHDQFCSVAECDRVIPHVNAAVLRADGDLELLCREHRAELVQPRSDT